MDARVWSYDERAGFNKMSPDEEERYVIIGIVVMTLSLFILLNLVVNVVTFITQ
jgi:hypothetical protein